MDFIIIGLGLGKSQEDDINNKKLLFNCEYLSLNCANDIIRYAKETATPMVIAVNVDNCKNEAYALSAEIRNRTRTFIIYVSENNDPDERLRWLSLGATTNITLPFHGEELIRRATKLIRHTEDNVIIKGDFIVELCKRTVIYNGELVKFTPQEYDLLVYFLVNSRKIIKRDDIMHEMFGTTQFANDRAIDTIIKRIRSKTSFKTIKTIHTVGYIFHPSVNK